MIVDPPPKLYSEESRIISSYFGISRENQSNEVTYNMLLTHILKCREEINTQSHPRFSNITPS